MLRTRWKSPARRPESRIVSRGLRSRSFGPLFRLTKCLFASRTAQCAPPVPNSLVDRCPSFDVLVEPLSGSGDDEQDARARAVSLYSFHLAHMPVPMAIGGLLRPPKAPGLHHI